MRMYNNQFMIFMSLCGYFDIHDFFSKVCLIVRNDGMRIILPLSLSPSHIVL